MNERIERRGEALLSLPVKTPYIIIGKMLPYFSGMLLICAGLTLYLRAPLIILLPLVPIILFFLSSALVIGMIARSFKELSFISIFFSTVATSYLFFPSIFANVHVISLISPLTLIVLTIQGTAWTVTGSRGSFLPDPGTIPHPCRGRAKEDRSRAPLRNHYHGYPAIS